MPPRLRQPVAAIYDFARSADDIADEGDASPAERLAALERYREELEAIAAGRPPGLSVFQALAPHVSAHSLPLVHFHELLDAFSRDLVKPRYADYGELLDYCRLSANPVGRIMLALHAVDGEENLRRSDAICTALQLVNFWQDVAIDWKKDRIYLPQEDLARFGIAEEDIAAGRWSRAWAALMDFEIERTRSLMWEGAPLVHALPGRIGLELRLVVQGGLRILEKIQRVRGDVFRQRPVLEKADWGVMLWRALWWRGNRRAP